MTLTFAPYTWCEDYPVSILENPGCFFPGEDYVLDQAAEQGIKLESTDRVFHTTVRVGDVFDMHAVPRLNSETRQYSYLVGILNRNSDRIRQA